MSTQQELHDKICKDAADSGNLIEAGWLSLRFLAIPPDAPYEQIEEMRKAFFAGAQHLFASIMSILEPGQEPTDNDLQRLTLINNELNRFVTEMKGKKADA